MVTAAPRVPTLYCPRCDRNARRDTFRPIMTSVPPGQAEMGLPKLNVLKHAVCGKMVYEVER